MGTPFIITICAVIVICIAVAIIVVSMMRTNSGLDVEERESAEDSSAPVDNPQSPTGPLSPFPPLPHQTQPLSEIYYYDDRASGFQPSAPLPPLTAPLPEHALPPEAPVPPIQPPTGPLPGHSTQ
jgi:hypothetical protein